jgi:hypothetical protein
MPIQTAADSISNSAGSPYGFKNRIINGAMVIDQRNAGASTTVGSAFVYTLDRWCTLNVASSKFSVQQNAGSVTPPPGFTNYLGLTSLAATSISAGDYYQVLQIIEGNNIADLDWGKSTAKPITISFWVRSSLTGSFGGALLNDGNSRSYPFSYTITSANTWEYETITIPGDTSGTWLTTNGIGLQLRFGLGVGSTYTTTGGAWVNGVYGAPTGSVNVASTNGATFYITGVQVEKGSQATAFDYRPYGTELQLCQRYYYRYNSSGNPQLFTVSASPGSDSSQIFYLRTPVPMRTAATCSSTAASTFGTWPAGSGGSNILGSSFYSLGMTASYPYQDIEFMITLASSPGTQTSRFGFRSSTAYIEASSEI